MLAHCVRLLLKYMYIALWSCKEVFWQIPDFMRYKSSHKDTQSSFLRSRSLFPSWIFPKPLLLFTMYYKRTPIDPWMTPPCNASWPMAGPAPKKCPLVGYGKKSPVLFPILCWILKYYLKLCSNCSQLFKKYKLHKKHLS